MLKNNTCETDIGYDITHTYTVVETLEVIGQFYSIVN